MFNKKLRREKARLKNEIALLKEELKQTNAENTELKKQIDSMELNFYRKLFDKININI